MGWGGGGGDALGLRGVLARLADTSARFVSGPAIIIVKPTFSALGGPQGCQAPPQPLFLQEHGQPVPPTPHPPAVVTQFGAWEREQSIYTLRAGLFLLPLRNVLKHSHLRGFRGADWGPWDAGPR